MIYLSGAIRPELFGTDGLGWLLTPNMGNRVPAGETWAADNGCFTQPKTYTDDRYLAWLRERLPHRDRCIFAPAPDVVGDAVATVERSLPMLAKIRELGYPAALVAQDGLGELVPVPWDAFDVLFIGGSTDWKLGPQAAELVVEAKRRGKGVHVGRVNGGGRFARFAELGADSADGTILRFGPTANAPRVLGWLATEARRLAQLTFDLYRDGAELDEFVATEFAL